MMRVALRCDGDDRVGTGHVARCLGIAAALGRRGARCEFVGRYGSAAARLVAAAGVPHCPPREGAPAGLPPNADAAVVDSYELADAEVEAAARELPVAAVVDGDRAPADVTVLSYHLDAADRLAGRGGLLGPDFAPVATEHAAARRARGDHRVLVTVGGGRAGRDALGAALDALGGDERLELFVAAGQPPPRAPEGAGWGWERGLVERIAWADLALSAAGSTAYELACAGVPTLLLAVTDNQLQVAETFGRAGVAVALDARGGLDAAAVRRAWEIMLAAAPELAAAGPATIDGYGAFRAADGLLAAFAGRSPEPPLRYRPARQADRDLLLQWRNDPEVRAASRSEASVSLPDHERWLTATLASLNRTLLVVEHGGEPVGTVRFDRRDEAAEISVTVGADCRGQGTGSRIIREASELYLSARPDVRQLLAEVREHNLASLAAFERAGYARADAAQPAGSRLLVYAFD